jgi:hypothetical protein
LDWVKIGQATDRVNVLALAAVLLVQAPAVSVSVDLRALSDDDYRQLDGLALERKLALRLVQEGFAVVSPDNPVAHVHVHVRVSRAADLLAVTATSRASALEQTVRLDAASLAELHLEIAQKVSELTRALEVRSRTERAQAPETATPPPPAAAAAPAPRDSRFDLTLGAAAASQRVAVDPLLLLAGRLRLNRLGLDVELGGTRSGGSGAAVAVRDVRAAVGLGYHISFARRLQLEPGVAFGIVLHAYEVPDRFANARNGTLVAPVGLARLRGRWAFAARFALELRLALALTRSIAHVSQGERLWHRGPVRAETGLGLTWML